MRKFSFVPECMRCFISADFKVSLEHYAVSRVDQMLSVFTHQKCQCTLEIDTIFGIIGSVYISVVVK